MKHHRNNELWYDAYLIPDRLWEGEMFIYSEFYSWNNVPYECRGFMGDGDVNLLVHGTMAEFDVLKMTGIVCGGRFSKLEIKPITEREANNLLKKLLLEC